MPNGIENRWLTSLNFKYDKGLIPSGSDLFYAVSMIRELNEQITELNDKLRISEEPRETVRKTGNQRSKKTRVRKGSDIRTASSILKNKTMEGGPE